jgi:hypothetical protein
MALKILRQLQDSKMFVNIYVDRMRSIWGSQSNFEYYFILEKTLISYCV